MAKAKASFEGLIPSTSYTGILSHYDGAAKAGGFSFKDMYIITEHAITVFGYQSTGYQVDMHGSIDAFFSAYLNTSTGYGKGYILSPSSETFGLKTGDFSSAWDISQKVTFTGYKGTHMKGQFSVTLNNSSVTVINFANYAGFNKITELKEFTNTATGGSSGKGWQVVVDNLKVHWNGAVPGSHGQGHVSHGVINAMQHHQTAGHIGSNGSSSGYHSELTSLGHDHGAGGLTSQFHLPQVEHFGV